MHTGTRDTLFNLAFGSNVVIQVEIGINSFRMAHFNPKKNESSLWASLDLLEEIKEYSNTKATMR